MDLSTFYHQFRDETAENLHRLADDLASLQAGQLDESERKSTIDAIFRAMHTIKGSARMLGFERVGQIAHDCEHALSAVREGRLNITPPLADVLLRSGDVIQEYIQSSIDGSKPALDNEEFRQTLQQTLPTIIPSAPASLEQAEPTNAIAPAPPLAPSQAGAALPDAPAVAVAPTPVAASNRSQRQTIRVRVDRLDRLLNLAGELKVNGQVENQHLQDMQDISQLLQQQTRSLLALDRELKQLRFSPTQREALDRHLNASLNRAESINTQIQGATEQFGRHTTRSGQIVQDLEQEVMAARLLPISTIYSHLPRAVRDIGRSLQKELELQLQGEEIELDRKAIEALGEPLTHLLRNAADHGIETPEERERLGKPRQGTIIVRARAYGASVQISVIDDGRGMNPQKIRDVAIRKGIVNSTTAAMLTDSEALELIFAPGFSTAAMITDVSGRGVGMDVVRTQTIELGGNVSIESHIGKGTTVTLIIPLTLVTTRVLLIEANRQIFGLPVSGCKGLTWISEKDVRSIEGRLVLPRPEGIAPLLHITELLGMGSAQRLNQERMPALLLGTSSRTVALLIDNLYDEREVVIKPLGSIMEKQRRYTGAFQLGDGKLVLLLNPMTLILRSQGMAMVAAPANTTAVRKSRLLVTDDSFATRELMRSILSAAGYDVTTAYDGMDALDKLRSETYDLVVSDVEMPRVNGFELTARIRNELQLLELPVIIITSLTSEAHRRQGLEAGAQAYIVKSQFNQSNLIDTIRQLLGS